MLRFAVLTSLLTTTSVFAQVPLPVNSKDAYVYSTTNSTYVIVVNPSDFVSAAENCSAWGLVMSPFSVTMAAFSNLTVSDPTFINNVFEAVTRVVSQAPEAQGGYDMWTWDARLPCRAQSYVFLKSNNLFKTASRPCSWTLSYACTDKSTALAAGFKPEQLSDAWLQRLAVARSQPSPYALGRDASGISLVQSGLAIGAAAPTNGSTWYDGSGQFWDEGPLMTLLWRYSRIDAKLYALLPLHQATLAPEATGTGAGATSSGGGLSVLSLLRFPSNMSALNGQLGHMEANSNALWEGNDRGPWHDYIVGVQGCFNAYTVERLALTTRSGLTYTLGRDDCTDWFEEKAPPGGYLAALQAWHTNAMLSLATVPDYRSNIQQLRLLWASTDPRAGPSYRLDRRPVPPASACPSARPELLRTDSTSMECGARSGKVCPTNQCCGDTVLDYITRLPVQQCGRGLGPCQVSCRTGYGMCGPMPEVESMTFAVGTATGANSPWVGSVSNMTTSSTGTWGQQAFYTANLKRQMSYMDATAYCRSLTLMGLDWSLPSVEDTLRWAAALDVRWNAYQSLLGQQLWVAVDPAAVNAAPSLACLLASFTNMPDEPAPLHTATPAPCALSALAVCRADPSQPKTGVAVEAMLPAAATSPGVGTKLTFEAGTHLLTLSQPLGAGSSGAACGFRSLASIPADISGIASNQTDPGGGSPSQQPPSSPAPTGPPQPPSATPTLAGGTVMLVPSALRFSFAASAPHRQGGGNAQALTGLQVVLNGIAEDPAGSASSGGWSTLELQPRELVVAASGCAGGYVESLVLHTSFGRRLSTPVGRWSLCSAPFLQVAPPGGYLVGLQGIAGFYIEQLEMVWGQPVSALAPPPLPPSSGGAPKRLTAAAAAGVGVGVGAGTLLGLLVVAVLLAKVRRGGGDRSCTTGVVGQDGKAPGGDSAAIGIGPPTSGGGEGSGGCGGAAGAFTARGCGSGCGELSASASVVAIRAPKHTATTSASLAPSEDGGSPSSPIPAAALAGGPGAGAAAAAPVGPVANAGRVEQPDSGGGGAAAAAAMDVPADAWDAAVGDVLAAAKSVPAALDGAPKAPRRSRFALSDRSAPSDSTCDTGAPGADAGALAGPPAAAAAGGPQSPDTARPAPIAPPPPSKWPPTKLQGNSFTHRQPLSSLLVPRERPGPVAAGPAAPPPSRSRQVLARAATSTENGPDRGPGAAPLLHACRAQSLPPVSAEAAAAKALEWRPVVAVGSSGGREAGDADAAAAGSGDASEMRLSGPEPHLGQHLLQSLGGNGGRDPSRASSNSEIIAAGRDTGGGGFPQGMGVGVGVGAPAAGWGGHLVDVVLPPQRTVRRAAQQQQNQQGQQRGSDNRSAAGTASGNNGNGNGDGTGTGSWSLHEELAEEDQDLLRDPACNLLLGRDVRVDEASYLGHGASGVVRRGTLHTPAGEVRVAVKLLTPGSMSEADPDHPAEEHAAAAEGEMGGAHGCCMKSAQQRQLRILAQEVRVLSRLAHPHIVRFFGACLSPPGPTSPPFIVEELMSINLSRLVHARHRGTGTFQFEYGLADILHISRDVAAGLSYLHPTVVHRDLKPGNVLLDESGVAKIGDFGLARFKASTVLSTREIEVGTAPYMAPEVFQASGDIKVTDRTDVYSLGVIMNEMITRRRPFEGLRPVVIGYQVAMERRRPPSPPRDSPLCPPGLRSLIARCLRHHPEQRPSAAEVVKRLTLLLAEHASEALASAPSHPPGPVRPPPPSLVLSHGPVSPPTAAGASQGNESGGQSPVVDAWQKPQPWRPPTQGALGAGEAPPEAAASLAAAVPAQAAPAAVTTQGGVGDGVWYPVVVRPAPGSADKPRPSTSTGVRPSPAPSGGTPAAGRPVSAAVSRGSSGGGGSGAAEPAGEAEKFQIRIPFLLGSTPSSDAAASPLSTSGSSGAPHAAENGGAVAAARAPPPQRSQSGSPKRTDAKPAVVAKYGAESGP